MSISIIPLEGLYPLTITTLLFCVYFVVQFRVRKIEKKRLKSIRKRDISDAIETESPVNDQESELKKIGIEGIETRFSFIHKILPVSLIFLWCILVIIPYLGKIPSVYVSIIAAIISVVAGFSLRPFLENLFAGLIISFFRSIKIGDTVIIDNHYGLIEEIGLTYSVIKSWNWHRVVIPNSRLLEKEIQNLSMNDEYIWAYVEFFVSPNADLEKVGNIVRTETKKSKYFYNVEEPSYWVVEVHKDSIKCWAAAWAQSPADAWELKNDMRTKILVALQKEKIGFQNIVISSFGDT